jgi:predicted PurR-regulated permease PerM
VIDRLGAFLRERTPRRAIALGIFLGLLVFFRHLLVLLVFFVVFERVLMVVAGALAGRTGLPRKAAVAVVALLVLGAASGAAYLGVSRGVRAVILARQTMPERLEKLEQQRIYQEYGDYLPDADEVVEKLQHYASNIFKGVSAVGHGLIYALIGFILAVVFVIEEEELRGFLRSIDPRSLPGTLSRWLGYLADAMLVTVQFQLVVAACNAILTFPVLLLVGIPHAPALALLIFVSGLVPVVGNFAMGAVLSVLAFQAKGWFGVGLFVVLTFILHKLESYYLNPRLAARHVRLPGFVIIISLVLWEHALGVAGLFISFPFLYVAQRIRDELRKEDGEPGQPSAPAVIATGT